MREIRTYGSMRGLRPRYGVRAICVVGVYSIGSVLGVHALSAGRLASWGDDGVACLWAADGTAVVRRDFFSPADARGAMQVEPLSGERLLVWSVLTWSAIGPRLWHPATDACTALSGLDNTAPGAWETREGPIVAGGVDGRPRFLAISPSPEALSGTAVGPEGPGSRITSRRVPPYGPQGSAIRGLTDGRLITRDREGMVRVWSPQGNSPIELERSRLFPFVVVERGNGTIAIVGHNRRVSVWSAAGELLAAVHHLGSDIATEAGLFELPDGRLVYWGDFDEHLYVLDPDTDVAAAISGHASPVGGALVRDDGTLISWGSDGSIRLWNPSIHPDATTDEHTGHVEGIVRRDDRSIVSWSSLDDDHALRVWTADGEPIGRLSAHTDGIVGACNLPDGALLSWGLDGDLNIWNPDGSLRRSLAGHSRRVAGALVRRDGVIVSWGRDDTIRLWSTVGEPVAVVRVPVCPGGDGVRELPNLGLLSWAPWKDYALRVWNATGAEAAVLKGHDAAVRGADILTDGRIVSWSADRSLRIWGSDGSPLFRDAGYPDAVANACARPNGGTISWCDGSAGGDEANDVWVRDADGSPVCRLHGHADAVVGASEMDDGRFVSWDEAEIRTWSTSGALLRALDITRCRHEDFTIWREYVAGRWGADNAARDRTVAPIGDRALVYTRHDVASGTCRDIYRIHGSWIRPFGIRQDGCITAATGEGRVLVLEPRDDG